MALTGTVTQGFESKGYTTGLEKFMWLSDPGDTHTRGQALYINNGVLDDAADSVKPLGICTESVVSPAATQYAAPPGSVNKIENDAASNCLTEIKMLVGAGYPIFKATFANHHDDTLAAYTSGTPSVTLTTSPGANDDTNGAIIYYHTGPGKGEIAVGDDYVHATKVLTTHRIAKATLTSSTQCLIFEGAGSSVGGVSFCGRGDSDTNAAFDFSDGYDDGDWMVFMDYHQMAGYFQLEQVLVIPSVAFYAS